MSGSGCRFGLFGCRPRGCFSRKAIPRRVDVKLTASAALRM
jgi:hypothetical protein